MRTTRIVSFVMQLSVPSTTLINGGSLRTAEARFAPAVPLSLSPFPPLRRLLEEAS